MSRSNRSAASSAKSKTLLLTFLLLVLTGAAAAAQVDTFHLSATINSDDTVETSTYLSFNGSTTPRNISLLLFGELHTVDAFFNEKKISCDTGGTVYTKITCPIPSVTGTLRVDATVTELVRTINGEKHFSLPVTFINHVNTFSADIRLPPGTAATGESSTRFNTTSDGKHIILQARATRLQPADTRNIEFSYTANTGETWKIAVPVAVLALLLIWALHRQRTPQYKTRLVIPLMKENERTIFRVLLDHGGDIFQKKLRDETGYSKAQVSRIVNDLVERGLVEKQQVGRTNNIVLKDFYRDNLEQVRDAFPKGSGESSDGTDQSGEHYPFKK